MLQYIILTVISDKTMERVSRLYLLSFRLSESLRHTVLPHRDLKILHTSLAIRQALGAGH